jgi:wyosine [tRNA(Phe)-imidazoG37] synthetase (radical SAM superfamily)
MRLRGVLVSLHAAVQDIYERIVKPDGTSSTRRVMELELIESS